MTVVLNEIRERYYGGYIYSCAYMMLVEGLACDFCAKRNKRTILWGLTF